MKEGTCRLDALMVACGLASGREKAKELIEAGLVTVNGKRASKASQSVEKTDTLVCEGQLHRYVGRGGEKLEKALHEAQISPQGLCCLDVGASTGGFTDCLLQHGAARVFALDVGHGQLHPSLCRNERVVNLEGMDIRRTKEVQSRMGADRPSFAVVDVSFISLKAIWPSVEELLASGATVVCLIKPQFEAGRAAVGKRGVVKDPAAHREVLCGLIDFWTQSGWTLLYLSYSPITGGEGNIEYLAVLSRQEGSLSCLWAGEIRDLVRQAHEALREKGGRSR